MDKGAKDKLVGLPRENGGGKEAQKILRCVIPVVFLDTVA
jgi:hypothetical protein